MDDSPAAGAARAAVAAVLAALPRLPGPCLAQGARALRTLGTYPLGVAAIHHGAVTFAADAAAARKEGGDPGEGPGGEDGGGADVRAATLRHVAGALEGPEFAAVRAEIEGVLEGVFEEMEDAEDGMDEDDLPEGSSVADRFRAAPAKDPPPDPFALPAAPWAGALQAPGPAAGGDAEAGEEPGPRLLPWSCPTELASTAMARWAVQSRRLHRANARAARAPAAGGKHWLQTVNRAEDVKLPEAEAPLPGPAPGAGPNGGGAPHAAVAMDLGYDDADQFTLGLEPKLQGPGPGGEAPRPAEAAPPGGAAGAEEEYIVPGVTQADLQAILADPARLQALLAEHPQLLELLG